MFRVFCSCSGNQGSYNDDSYYDDDTIIVKLTDPKIHKKIYAASLTNLIARQKFPVDMKKQKSLY